jgi:hypothetical protein
MPLALTDDPLLIIQQHAEPLHPKDRGDYLQRVAALLEGHEVGDGLVSRCARAAQREFVRPPH